MSKYLWVLFVALALAACGDDNGSGSNSDEKNDVISVIDDQGTSSEKNSSSSTDKERSAIDKKSSSSVSFSSISSSSISSSSGSSSSISSSNVSSSSINACSDCKPEDQKESSSSSNLDEERAKHVADSLAAVEKARQDSIQHVLDSLRALDPDPPTAEITPPAGRYYAPIKLKVKCDEVKCKTYISIDDNLHPQDGSKATEYGVTGSVFYQAEDSLGNKSEWEEAKYEMASDNICGTNAYPVPLGGKTVCVDAYEYPNKVDELPRDMVSQEQAAALCQQEGKHLCSLAEWQAACKSKDNTRYSYGDGYNKSKCNTETKAAVRSGRKSQCRSWFGMYDMNGNLWEWTSTTSKDHPNMYLVAGGAWNTGNESKCTDSKFGFYPQNQYPNVGFRCCK